MTIGKDIKNLKSKLNDYSPEQYQQMVLKSQLEQSKMRWGLINQGEANDKVTTLEKEISTND
ncbi:hypothetical protein [Paraferrimonas sp. SM1919]|uniref:hypothetical protein n=1 Tax=Paraferrimonas sp. SM1919 TaxID=2662263 RepID=UPI0013D2E6D9|nr:hypothetical protein [Paraferrimonas sp. SM1919]